MQASIHGYPVLPSFHAVSNFGSEDHGTLRQYGLSSILLQLPGCWALAACAMRLLKSRHSNCPWRLTGGFDLFVLEEARLLASATACQAVRGERQPELRYGPSTVVDGDETSVHDVLGFSNEAVQSGRAVTVFCNCCKASVSPPLTIGLNDAIQSFLSHTGPTSSLPYPRGQGISHGCSKGRYLPSSLVLDCFGKSVGASNGNGIFPRSIFESSF
mmetsp:Transcript_25301/g.45582  ORF Transcript_25301/g.45582 Transcript_25301/m.45582 type:complete len:215 (+) Transcript_25301:763-1407(+)